MAEFVAYFINGRDEANPLLTKEDDNKRWGFPGIPPRDACIKELTSRTLVPHVSLQQDLLNTPKKPKALIFTKMEDYVHDSTPAMAGWVLTKLTEMGWQGVITDDGSTFECGEKLAMYDLIVLLNNSGQIFDPNKTEHLMKHIESGKGVVGVHAALASFLNGKDASGATIMEPTCDILETIFGSHFQNHPPVQTGSIVMNAEELDGSKAGSLLACVPKQFTHTDEFFNFTKNVAECDGVTVLAYADESTYEGGTMGEKHPIAWFREVCENKAPVFYSGLGHFSHFYNGTGPEYVTMILEAGLQMCAKC